MHLYRYVGIKAIDFKCNLIIVRFLAMVCRSTDRSVSTGDIIQSCQSGELHHRTPGTQSDRICQ